MRGVFILLLLALAIGAALILFALRAPKITDTGKFSTLSREGGLLLNNVLLACSCAVVFFGTLYALFQDMVTGEKITVGAPYFNQTFLPILGVLILAAGVGPFLAWKSAKLPDVLRRCRTTLVVTAIVCILIALLTGVRDPVGLLGVAIAVWLAVATSMDLARRAGLPGVSLLTALNRLRGLPSSAWALYIGHTGLAIAAAGIVAISVWRIEAIQLQKKGTPVGVGEYQFTLMDVSQASGPNYQATVATAKVERNGKIVTLLFPERRWYPVEQNATTEAGISTRWHGDLYAVLGDPNGSDGFVTLCYYNPGVPWMWFGVLLIAVWGLISLADRRLRIGAQGRIVTPSALQPAE